MKQCEATKADGTRCRQFVWDDTRFCLWHDPARKKHAQAMRSKGGQAAGRAKRKTPPPDELPEGAPQTAEEALKWSSWLTKATASGRIDPRTSAQVAASLRVFLQSLEKSEMERRVRELQETVDTLKKGKGR